MKVRKIREPQTITVNVGVTAVSGAKPFVGDVNDAKDLFLHQGDSQPPLEIANLSTDITETTIVTVNSEDLSIDCQNASEEEDVDVDYNDDVFSPTWVPPKFNKKAKNYGRPKKGSLTEKRGIEAGHQVAKEIVQLCEVIDENGKHNDNGTVTISFGDLFKNYVYISDKVVGMLLRARKHQMVAFEGEMLFQRRDEKVAVTLLHPLDEVRRLYAQTDDPSCCVSR